MRRAFRVTPLYVACILVCCMLSACSKYEKPESVEPVYPIYFLQKSYEVRLHYTEHVDYYNGGSKLDVSTADDGIATADLDNDNKKLKVSGNGKGETTVTVTDREAETTVRLNVKVVDPYLCFRYNGEGNLSVIGRTAAYLCLVNDAERTFYFLKRADDGSDMPTGEILLEGTYKTEVKDNRPCLTLYYNIQGIDQADTYNLKASGNAVYDAMNRMLNCNWPQLDTTSVAGTSTRGDYTPSLLFMKKDGEGKEAVLSLYMRPIPSGILK